MVVMSGSAVAQATGFLLAPVISRLFSPADFGIFGTFGAVTGVITAFVTLDYSQAIMLPKRREDAGQVFILSCLVTLCVSCLCLVACLVVPDLFMELLQTLNGWVLGLLVLAVLAGGLNASFQAWCVRVKAFKQTSVSQVVRGLSSNGLQVAFGSLKAGAPGLIVSSVLAEILASLNLFRVVQAELRGFVAAAHWEQLKSLAREYWDFPAYSATQNVLNALSNGLPVLLLTHYYGIAVAGTYAFGMRLLSAPMSLVMGALRQVLFQKAGESQHEEQPLAPLFVRTTLGLFVLGLPPAIVLGIWAPGLFTWLFGSQWQGAGEFARYLIAWILFVFCNVPAILFARLIRIQRTVFFYNVLVLLVRVLALVAGGRYLGALECILLFSAVGAGLNLGLILLVGRAVLRREGQVTLAKLRPGTLGRLA
ncbi:MAG: oligosaccharide flippase family protein [Verrucomicrobia bacterium]|nr:oligosaccharide flippase family protein [Verrucomicrobiota bacterium]